MKVRIALCILVAASVTSLLPAAAAASEGDENAPIRFPSPDDRFALRISAAQDTGDGDSKIDIIEKASGKVMLDLETAYSAHMSDTVLVWSADSKWVAYATRNNREGETSVYFWNGSAFAPVPLPETPSPHIKYRKGDENAGVKNYGGATKPVRWLKSGGLELSSDQVMLSKESGVTYTGTVLVTIGFDAQHHASVKKVSKTKTKVE
jgi:hypothetical protein